MEQTCICFVLLHSAYFVNGLTRFQLENTLDVLKNDAEINPQVLIFPRTKIFSGFRLNFNNKKNETFNTLKFDYDADTFNLSMLAQYEIRKNGLLFVFENDESSKVFEQKLKTSNISLNAAIFALIINNNDSKIIEYFKIHSTNSGKNTSYS